MVCVLAANSILPPLAVLPLACVAILATFLHLSWMHRHPMPPSRRRIRTATGVLSLFTIPLTAYGFGIVSPDDERLFLLVWLTVLGLLGILVTLAMVDMLNNVRLHSQERRHVRTQLHRLQDELRGLAQERDRG